MFRKTENWIFYIFLFAIPISVRHIFWFEPFNFVEWTATYIYITDLLLITLLFFWVIGRWRPVLFDPVVEGDPLGKPTGLVSWVWGKEHRSPATIILWLFVVVAGISIWNALNVSVAVFAWLKLVEGVALYFYIKEYALKRFKLVYAFEAIVAGAVFQAVIAIAQFMMQGSLGLKYLGESPLAPAMSGIAAFFVDGLKIMRAYGTTPHSNVLALYLFIALNAFYFLYLKTARSNWWWHIFHVVILWAFFLTFSRVIIGLWILNFVILLAANIKKIVWTTFGVCAAFLVCYWPYVANRTVISSNDEAVQLRILYNNESLKSGQNVFGLGMGNFVPWLMTQNLHLNREVYQPVHNIYLLIYAEVGIVGIALFILFLAFLLYDFYHFSFAQYINIDIRSAKPQAGRCCIIGFGLVIISVLVFGLFDHYLWTIQSGRLLFWLVLGLLAGAKRF